MGLTYKPYHFFALCKLIIVKLLFVLKDCTIFCFYSQGIFYLFLEPFNFKSKFHSRNNRNLVLKLMYKNFIDEKIDI